MAQAGLRAKLNHQGRGIGRAAKRAPSQLSFHSLRHTAVSLLKEAGIPQAVVQELVGHDSEQMSALYTHIGREGPGKGGGGFLGYFEDEFLHAPNSKLLRPERQVQAWQMPPDALVGREKVNFWQKASSAQQIG